MRAGSRWFITSSREAASSSVTSASTPPHSASAVRRSAVADQTQPSTHQDPAQDALAELRGRRHEGQRQRGIGDRPESFALAFRLCQRVQDRQHRRLGAPVFLDLRVDPLEDLLELGPQAQQERLLFRPRGPLDAPCADLEADDDAEHDDADFDQDGNPVLLAQRTREPTEERACRLPPYRRSRGRVMDFSLGHLGWPGATGPVERNVRRGRCLDGGV